VIEMLHLVTGIASELSSEEISKHADLLSRIREHHTQTRATHDEFQHAWTNAKTADEKRQLIAHTTAIMERSIEMLRRFAAALLELLQSHQSRE
jgi:hypothetical protein